MKDRISEQVCGARVKFQSVDAIKFQAGQKISSGQGSLICKYPNGECQLANKKARGFVTKKILGSCLAKKGYH